MATIPTNTFTGASSVNFLNTPTTTPSYNMGTVNVGGNPSPNSTLTSFNQSMVNPSGTNNTGSASGVYSNYGMNSKVNDITNKSTQLGIINQPTTTTNQQAQNNVQTGRTIDYSTAPYQTDANGTKVYYNPASGQYDQYQSTGGVVNYGGISVPSETLSDPSLKSIVDNQLKARQENKTAYDAQLEAIKNRFIQYRDTQNKLTQSGAAGVQNALLQSGAGGRGSVAQYAAATSDARVNSIMEDGQKALQELDNQEAQLKAAALSAYQTQDYKMLDSINSAIEKKRQEQVDAAKSINSALATEQAKSKVDTAVADLYSQGTTDIPTILNKLKEQGITASASTIQDTIKNITPNGLDDLVKTMRINNAPENLIQQTINTGITKGVGSAYTQAGKYGAGGTGIIGEYNYALANGWKGTGDPSNWFNQYQTADANRKAQLTNGAGLSTQQNASFLRITDNFQKDELIKNTFKGVGAVAIADQIIANPNSATNQLKSLYALVKNLDPDSAVREGEITLANKTQSYLQTWGTALTRIYNGQVISPDTAKNLAIATKELVQTWNESAKARQKQYEAQAKGAGIGEAFNDYIQASSVPYATADKLIKDTKKLESDFDSLMIKDKEGTTKAYQTLWQQLGHKPTAEEFFQWNPDLIVEGNQSFNTVGGDTDPAKGIVLGVDITKYATDPQHETKIASLIQKIPDDFDTYIKSVAPNSKVTGDMITTASNTYGVDPKLVIAIIQNDSRFGTLGYGATNNNPGNIGQFDKLKTATKGYNTLQEGVNAVAQWLANHKTNKYA